MSFLFWPVALTLLALFALAAWEDRKVRQEIRKLEKELDDEV